MINVKDQDISNLAHLFHQVLAAESTTLADSLQCVSIIFILPETSDCPGNIWLYFNSLDDIVMTSSTPIPAE